MLANILESERNLTRQHDVSKINRSGKPGKRTYLSVIRVDHGQEDGGGAGLDARDGLDLRRGQIRDLLDGLDGANGPSASRDDSDGVVALAVDRLGGFADDRGHVGDLGGRQGGGDGHRGGHDGRGGLGGVGHRVDALQGELILGV